MSEADEDHSDDVPHPVLFDIDLSDRLMTACRTGDTWHVAECLASPRVKEHINPALLEAARCGQVEVVELLLVRDDCDINYR